jgi:hypothetical protein
MIRQALDDAVACGAFAPSESYTLKAEFLSVQEMLGSRENPGRSIVLMRVHAIFKSSTYQPSPEQMEALVDAWRYWRREPERSRRVLRLAIANWLAYDDLPSDRRPAPDPGVTGPFELYALGPESPAEARALSPVALDRWMSTAIDAQELLRAWDFRALRLRERANHRALVVLLASELYRRERGTGPPSDEALVGPYLKELPDDGLGDAARQATPGAGEAKASPG